MLKISSHFNMKVSCKFTSIPYMSQHCTSLPSYWNVQSYWDYTITFVHIHKSITMHFAFMWSCIVINFL